MFFKRKVTVHDLVIKIRGEVNRARVHHLQTTGIVDSQMLPDLDKITISQTVDTIIADIVLITGLMKRVVDHGRSFLGKLFCSNAPLGFGTRTRNGIRQSSAATNMWKPYWPESKPGSAAPSPRTLVSSGSASTT